jgi:hypothetical protein
LPLVDDDVIGQVSRPEEVLVETEPLLLRLSLCVEPARKFVLP